MRPSLGSDLLAAPSPPPLPRAMDPQHLHELIDLEDSYWWHIAKRQLVAEMLRTRYPAPDRIVEGGIGSGRNLYEFQQLGYDVHGLDIMPASVEHCRHRGLDDVHVHDLAQPWPLPAHSMGAVVLLDVLEHIEHPVEVLRHARSVLRDNGAVIVTVPAYPWLYGDWDRRLGHHRRYTSELLREHATAAGFRIDWLTHWNAFTLPAAIAVRSYQRCFPQDRSAEFPRVSPRVNRWLLSMSRWERWWMKRARVPFGLSFVGVLVPCA
jgi:SAM-dependent methyltransferase